MNRTLIMLVALMFGATAITATAASTDESLPGMAAQPASYFYTGKPYDEDLDGYLFAFRNYDPELSRWTTADPAGFPDGPNGRNYTPTPTSQLDPYGLRTITATHTDHNVQVWGVPVEGSSGSSLSITIPSGGAPHQVGTAIKAQSQVQWNVTASTAGWVVQHITIDISGVYNEDGSQWTPSNPPTPQYWEAWNFDLTNGIQYSGIDNFTTISFPESTYGHVQITGKVDFYSESVAASDDPWLWGTVSEAGLLVAKTTEPSFWTGSGFNHSLEMTWE